MSRQPAPDTEPVDLLSIGDLLAEQVIVYVHGFGVRYDSGGLFSRLAEILAGRGCRSVLFDLSDYDEDDNVRLLPLGRQVDRLGRALAQVQETDSDLVLLGHSLGCLVIARYLLDHRLDVARIFLLDPATYNQIGSAMKAGYSRRPNARATPDGIELTRRSGRRTKIGDDYFHDLNFETADLYRRLADACGDRLTVVWAGQEEAKRRRRVSFVGAEEVVIEDASHNFDHHHQPLADILAARLEY